MITPHTPRLSAALALLLAFAATTPTLAQPTPPGTAAPTINSEPETVNSTPAAPAAPAAAPGRIMGQVFNEATKAALKDATITIRETRRSYIAEDGGRFDISLPPAQYNLVFEYPGLDIQAKTIIVESGRTTTQDIFLGAEVYVLEKISVVGEREGNAAAIAAQRAAIASATVLSMDAFGDVAKGNIGNMLKRIPGIAGMMAGDGSDTDSISVRGNTSDLIAIDIDGTRAASADLGSRSIDVATLMSDAIERVEVIKTSTPDMDADSIGGRINLVTKSAYDTSGRRISFGFGHNFSLTYGTKIAYGSSNSFSPDVTLYYSEPFSVFGGRRNLGIVLSANYRRVLDLRSTTGFDYQYPSNNYDSLGVSQFGNTSIQMNERITKGATLRVDYRFSHRLEMSVSARANQTQRNMLRSRNQYGTGYGLTNLTLSTDPYFTIVDGSYYRPEQQDRRETNNDLTYTWRTKWKPNSSTTIDADVSFARQTAIDTDDFIRVRSRRNFNYAMDRRGAPRYPTLLMLSDFYTGSVVATSSVNASFRPDISPFDDPLTYGERESLYFNETKQMNEHVSYRVDVTKRVDWRFPITFKTGVRYQTDIKTRDRIRLQASQFYVTDDSGNTRATRGDFTPWLSENWRFGGAVDRYPIGVVPDIKKIKAAVNPVWTNIDGATQKDPQKNWSYNTDIFGISVADTLSNSIMYDRIIWENISAAYGQATLRIKRLEVLAGMRMERTDITRLVHVRNTTINPATGVAYFATTDPGRYLDTRYELTSYSNALPSVNAKFTLTSKLVLKAAFTTNLGRPTLSDYLSDFEMDNDPTSTAINADGEIIDENRTLRAPNLNLKPRETKSYDFSAEYYLRRGSYITASVFHTTYKHYSTSVVWSNMPASEAIAMGATLNPRDQEAYDRGDPVPLWDITTRDDSGYGERTGFEIGYTQQFDFLPGWLSGFAMYANGMVQTAKGNFAGRRDNMRYAARLTNSPPRTANIGLSYAQGRKDFRIQWNFVDDTYESIDGTAPDIRSKILASRYQFDFMGKYKINRKFTLFCNLTNLSTNPTKKYRGWVDPSRQSETNLIGFVLSAGIQGAF